MSAPLKHDCKKEKGVAPLPSDSEGVIGAPGLRVASNLFARFLTFLHSNSNCVWIERRIHDKPLQAGYGCCAVSEWMEVC